MKILAICPTAGLSGVDQVFNYMCSGLARHGLDVTAVLPLNAQIKDDLIVAGVNVEESTTLGWWFNPAFSDDYVKTALENSKPSIHHILDLIRRIDPDVVVSNTSVCMDGLIAAMISGKPHLSHVHALFVDNIYTKMTTGFKHAIYGMLAGPNSAMMVPAAELKNHLTQTLPQTQDNVFVVPNGIDTERFVPGDKEASATNIRILSLGHFNDNKNQKLLVDVAAELRLLGARNFHFQLVGPGEGEYIAAVRRYIDERSLNGHFELIDSQNNVLPLLHGANIYINSSTTETFPVSVLEAMATALPVVCTPTVGGKEIVDPGVTGYIGSDAKELAKHLFELFNDSDLRLQMGRRGRIRVLENYSVEIFTQRVVELLQAVAERQASNTPNLWLEKIFFSDLIRMESPSVKTRIAVVIPDRGQTSYELLIRKPFDVLMEKDSGLTVSVFAYGEISRLELKEFDLLYIFRIYAEPITELAERAKDLEIPIVFETDDNYFALHFHEGNPVHESTENKHLEDVISLASAVIVYSDAMEKAAKKYNKRVQRLRPYQLVTRYRQFPDAKTTIGFMGSLKKDTDFEFVTPALVRLLSDFPNLSIEFYGFVPEELLNTDRVTSRNFNPNYDEFIAEFHSRSWTVGLAPLADTEFNRSKTNNKYREYAAASYAGVYSNVQPYSSSIVNGKTGLLVNNDTDAWYAAIKLLLDDRELRGTITRNAFHDMEQNYTFESHVGDKLKAIRKLIVPKVVAPANFKADWYPTFATGKTPMNINLISSNYLCTFIRGYQGSLCAIDVVLIDYIDAPDSRIGIEVIYRQEIVAHVLRHSATLKRNAVNSFPLNQTIEVDGDIEVRVFTRGAMGPIKLLGKTRLLKFRHEPWVGLISHSHSTGKGPYSAPL